MQYSFVPVKILPTLLFAGANTHVDTSAEREKGENLQAMFNLQQRAAFNAIMAAVNRTSHGKFFYLSGAGGTGKTFVYNALSSTILGNGGRVKCVAPTGLAATLLPSM